MKNFSLQRISFLPSKSIKLGAVSNFYEDARILETAGVSIGGEEEAYLISKSIIVRIENGDWC